MELNREQVIKALECCSSREEDTCDYCPLTEISIDCGRILHSISLSLIEELTEENERQRSEISVKRKLLDKAEVRMDCLEEVNKVLQADICNATMNLEHLTKENERLSAYNENLIKTNTYLSNHLLDEVQQAKDLAIADTVKKMHSEIEARCIKGGIYPAFVASTIDQIAKEIIGEIK